MKDDNALMVHMKSAHGQKQGKKCTQCPQVMGSEKLLRRHIKDNHSNWEYECEICKDKFNTMNDAREHSLKSCGNIKQKEVVIDIEDVEIDHRCNACSLSYDSNKHLEKHMEEHHATDCTKCHAIFKSQDDMYKHANVCSEIIAPLLCEKCNRELISKAGLEKHMERCKGEEQPTSNKKPKQQQSKEKCTNGQKCRFLKENRCLFVHKEHKQSKHVEKEPRRNLEISCQTCSKTFSNHREKHSHRCEQHDNESVQERRKNTDCKRGPSCFRLAEGSCWFRHSPVPKRPGQQGQRSATSKDKDLWCRFQDKCTTRNCTYKHFELGFQQRNQHRRN